MDNIIEIHLGHLKNDLHIFAMEFVLNAIRSYKIIAEDFPVAYKTLQDVFDLEKDAYKRLDRNFIAQELKEAKKERDNAFRSLKTFLKSVSLSVEPHSEQKIEAATFLLAYLKSLGGSDIIYKPYDATSGILNGIIDNLEGQYSEKAELCFEGHYEVLDFLKQANARFLELQALRDKDLAEHGRQEMRRARLMTDRAYRALIYSVNIKAYLAKTTLYDPFIAFLNAELNSLKLKLRAKGADTPLLSPEAFPETLL